MFIHLKKPHYTPAEVARMASVSRQTVVKWIETGRLEAHTTPGGHHRIPASALRKEPDAAVGHVVVELDLAKA